MFGIIQDKTFIQKYFSASGEKPMQSNMSGKKYPKIRARNNQLVTEFKESSIQFPKQTWDLKIFLFHFCLFYMYPKVLTSGVKSCLKSPFLCLFGVQCTLQSTWSIRTDQKKQINIPSKNDAEICMNSAKPTWL